MDRKVLVAALVAAMAGMVPGATVPISPREDAPQRGPMLGYTPSRGKGRGKRPHHPSSRYVAMDKRDARKARNRRRGR